MMSFFAKVALGWNSLTIFTKKLHHKCLCNTLQLPKVPQVSFASEIYSKDTDLGRKPNFVNCFTFESSRLVEINQPFFNHFVNVLYHLVVTCHLFGCVCQIIISSCPQPSPFHANFSSRLIICPLRKKNYQNSSFPLIHQQTPFICRHLLSEILDLNYAPKNKSNYRGMKVLVKTAINSYY